MSKTKVKAKDGLKVFFPLDCMAAPGRKTFVLEGEAIIEVDTVHRFVRRSIRCGDLVVVKTKSVGEAPAKPKRKKKPAEGKEG